MYKRLPPFVAACGLLIGLAAFQGNTPPPPEKRARKITMYYLPIHSFIRYHIDSLMIRSKHQLETRVRQPDAFLTRLKTSLGPGRAADAINYQHIRILYAVTYTDGSQQKILADAGGNVLWNGRLYEGSRTLDHVLESPIGPKDRKKIDLPQRKTTR
ncbi:hypothetical protein I2I05_17455 [Hymenobacter sp. BT683]|uniref:Uncharacterized protein n=1 Tax=Hymenobacter jeongseonensis TaxID=2791027 RepID=A0ABS0IN32_9BACT|nr:hypothetical protein [Hymenobacter jeongseonensis]MBF9239195.1 hypothetical protein [Hymenobacter jeongseonensis]